jgi:hypothetical protein
MASNRKYAALPDLVCLRDQTQATSPLLTVLHLQDSAPDIYETPELTDDLSTVPVRLARASAGLD